MLSSATISADMVPIYTSISALVGSWLKIHRKFSDFNFTKADSVMNKIESRLHFKHSLSWRPRSPRDLLLSVALEKTSPVKLPTDALPKLAPQVLLLLLHLFLILSDS